MIPNLRLPRSFHNELQLQILPKKADPSRSKFQLKSCFQTPGGVLCVRRCNMSAFSWRCWPLWWVKKKKTANLETSMGANRKIDQIKCRVNQTEYQEQDTSTTFYSRWMLPERTFSGFSCWLAALSCSTMFSATATWMEVGGGYRWLKSLACYQALLLGKNELNNNMGKMNLEKETPVFFRVNGLVSIHPCQASPPATSHPKNHTGRPPP